jgi:hypothetical protein
MIMHGVNNIRLHNKFPTFRHYMHIHMRNTYIDTFIHTHTYVISLLTQAPAPHWYSYYLSYYHYPNFAPLLLYHTQFSGPVFGALKRSAYLNYYCDWTNLGDEVALIFPKISVLQYFCSKDKKKVMACQTNIYGCNVVHTVHCAVVIHYCIKSN